MAVDLKLDGAGVNFIPVSQKTTPRYIYKDGERTSEPVMLNGKQVYSFQAAIALAGNQIGVGRVDSTSEVINADFGSMLSGKGNAVLHIGPKNEFELRVVLTVDEVVPVSTNAKGR